MIDDNTIVSQTSQTQTTVMRIPREGESSGRPLEASQDRVIPIERPLAILGDQPQQQLYREFVECIYDAMLVTNYQGWIIDANSRATELLGFEMDALSRFLIYDLICGASEDLFKQIVEDLRQGTRLILEAHCSREDGQVFPCEIAVNRIRLGTSDHACFLIRNIRRRVEAEHKLRESEKRFRDISEAMSDWIWEIDLEGNYTYCSQHITSLLGYDQDSLIEQFILASAPIEERVISQSRLRHLLSLKQPFRDQEFWLKARSGEKRCISFSGCPIVNDDNEITGYRGIAADVTESKRKDEELERHRNNLEEQVQKRTEELLTTNRVLTHEISERRKIEQDLRHAVQSLERSNDELEQFGYVVSHDLKEPLRMIASYCDLIQRRYGDHLDDRGKQFISYAVDGSEKVQKMIEDLLAYSKLSAERNVSPVDISSILNQCRRNLRLSIEECGALVEAGPMPIVRGDRTQLLLLFQNLLSNAIKFRRSEIRPLIRVSAQKLTHEDPVDLEGDPKEVYYRFRVQDNGIGIPDEASEDVFMIFHRAHDREEYGGTGIGLSICRKIVANHGGTIYVESTTGNGTSFYFTLPEYDRSRRQQEGLG